jgi:hypothetical protein
MDTKNQGGPAFPGVEVVEYGSGPRAGHHTGMSLRDYFAVHAPPMETPAMEVAEALAGRKLPEGRMEREIFWLDVDAEQRHLWAEAMLRARKDEA